MPWCAAQQIVAGSELCGFAPRATHNLGDSRCVSRRITRICNAAMCAKTPFRKQCLQGRHAGTPSPRTESRSAPRLRAWVVGQRGLQVQRPPAAAQHLDPLTAARNTMPHLRPLRRPAQQRRSMQKMMRARVQGEIRWCLDRASGLLKSRNNHCPTGPTGVPHPPDQGPGRHWQPGRCVVRNPMKTAR